MIRKNELTVVTFALLALVGAVTPAAAAGGGTTFAVQSNNTTSTPTPMPSPTATPTAAESTSAACEPRAGGTKLQQARLYSPRPTITGDQHGQISGTIALDIQNECPVMVQLTMNVPTGMYVAGSGDLSSGGGGIVTSTFVVDPGETKSLRANVYSNSPGEKTVTADITYFPEGHKDEAREVDGIMLNFDVEEENMPNDPNTPASTETTAPGGDEDPIDGEPSVLERLIRLIGFTQIGLLVLVALGLVLLTQVIPDDFDFDINFRKK